MKKTLVALAAFAATASFADVVLTGTFDAAYQHSVSGYQNNASIGQSTLTNNGRGTSQITFKVTEDLGGGLSAIAQMENDFYSNAQANSTAVGGAAGNTSEITTAQTSNFGVNGGEIFTGLTGGFGTVKLGAPNTPTLSFQGANPFGTKIGSGFGEKVMGSAHIRQNNTVNYTSPVMGGLTVSYGHSFGANANANMLPNAVTALGAVDDMSAVYANGPVSAGIALFKQADVAGTNDNRLTSYFGSYTFGAAKLMVGGHSESNGTASGQYSNVVATTAFVSGNDHTGTYIAGTYNMGATTFLFNLANRTDKTPGNVATPLNQHMTALGIDYALSKNTTVYARYSNYTQDNLTAANTAATALAKETKTAAGVQVNF